MGKRRVVRTVALIVVALIMTACGSYEKVDEAHIGVRYTDGWMDGQKFDKVVDPGGTEYVFNDHVYRLPTRQITWNMTDNGGDAPALTITAKGGEKLNMGLSVRGFLNTREGPTKQFFLEICQKDRTLKREGQKDLIIDGCWDDASGEGPAGWILMLTDAFGDPAIAVANDVASTYDAEKLRYDSTTKRRFETEFAEAFRDQQRKMIGNSGYFCGPGYDRNEDNKEADGWCPDLAVQVTGIRYENEDLENIRSEKELSAQREELAVQETQTALAQQATNAAKATAQNLALMEAQAQLNCSTKPACTMIIVTGDGNRPVNVNTGG